MAADFSWKASAEAHGAVSRDVSDRGRGTVVGPDFRVVSFVAVSGWPSGGLALPEEFLALFLVLLLREEPLRLHSVQHRERGTGRVRF